MDMVRSASVVGWLGRPEIDGVTVEIKMRIAWRTGIKKDVIVP